MKTRFILIETSHAGNVGAAARAMKVMGFDELVLVKPRWANVLRKEETIQRASGANDVLDKARVVETLDEALDGVTHLCATAMTPLGRVNLVSVHLTRPWPFEESWGQISQTMLLDQLLEEVSGPVVVAGDFNSVSSARIGKQVQQDIGLRPAPGFPGTWPSSLPSALSITIDQVYASPDLVFVNRRLGRPTGSDHRPVVTEITRAAD